MSEKRVVLDDDSNAELNPSVERYRLVVTRVTNSGVIDVGTFDFADFTAIASWAAKAAKLATPPNAVDAPSVDQIA